MTNALLLVIIALILNDSSVRAWHRGLAELMASLGQGTVEEAEEHLASVEEIPVRTINISGVGMPLRAFI